MATWPASAGFMERHTATMDLMRSLKAYLNLPQAELAKTAGEIEQTCLDSSVSKDDYLAKIQEKKQSLLQPSSALPKTASDIPATTGVSEMPGVENQAIGKYTAIYHERSLNATIYRANDTDSGAAIALKIVSLDAQQAPHDVQREAAVMRALAGQPHILPLLGAERLAGGLFTLKLPFLRYDLGSLAALRADGSSNGGSSNDMLLNTAHRCHHLRGLFEALAAVHAAGIIHRDIKPGNVLLADPFAGPALLADFGTAWAPVGTGTANDEGNYKTNEKGSEPADGKITDVGTGAYRPPELLFGCRDYGPALDMWAAGCVAAEVLEGGGRSLFDAGPVTRDDFLGSDLALLNSVFRRLGTPDDEQWPEARSYRDWGKIQFKVFPPKPWRELLPHVDDWGRDLVSKLVVYSTSRRLTAAQALEHPFFASI